MFVSVTISVCVSLYGAALPIEILFKKQNPWLSGPPSSFNGCKEYVGMDVKQRWGRDVGVKGKNEKRVGEKEGNNETKMWEKECKNVEEDRVKKGMTIRREREKEI